MSLQGWRIAVTRPAHAGWTLSRTIDRLGGQPLWTPLIGIEGPRDSRPLAEAIERLGQYQWALFTSAAAVRAVADAGGARRLAAVRLAAIGPATAGALRSLGLTVSLLSSRFDAATLGATLPVAPGDRVLLPRSRAGSAVLPALLQARGAVVDAVEAYSLVEGRGKPVLARALAAGAVDCLTLFSPSAVSVLSTLADPARLPAIVAVGPVTSAAAAAKGFVVTRVAERFDEVGVVEALVELVGQETGRSLCST